MTANVRNPHGRLRILRVAPSKGHSMTPKSFGLCVLVYLIFYIGVPVRPVSHSGGPSEWLQPGPQFLEDKLELKREDWNFKKVK